MATNLEEYIVKLEKLIDDKELDNFWVMCDRVDFKPLKKSQGWTYKIIKKMLKEKAQYYANKKIANINLYTNPKAVQEDKDVFSIRIIIFEIDEDGKINKDEYDNWGFMVNYKLKDLGVRKFKMKDVEKMMRLCAEKTLRSDAFNGISFTNMMKRLKDKDISLDD